MSSGRASDRAPPVQPIAILAPAGRDAQVIQQTLQSSDIAAEPVQPERLIAGIIDGSLAGAFVSEEALTRFDLSAMERAIDSQPAWSDFPIVLLTFRGTAPVVGAETIERLGHVSLLERPLHPVALISAARGVLRARTRQNEMEEFLRQRQEARANLEALNDLRELFESAPGFIAVLVGPQHHFNMANAAFRRLVRRELLGRTVQQALPEVAEQGVLQILDRVYRTGRPYAADEVPLQLTNSSGVVKNRCFAIAMQPLFDDNRNVRGVFTEAFEVTTRKLAQERVQMLQNELIQMSRMSAMGAMASTLAHELNQPLMAITSYLSAGNRLLASGSLEQASYAMRQGEIAALRAGDVIRRAREMVAGNKSYHERVDLEVLVSDALELSLLGLSELGPLCTTHYEADIAVTVDRVQIQQVVLNIVRNALEAMDGLDRRELVVTTARVGDRLAEVAIADTGPGLEEKVREQLFTPFVTSKIEGLGVGLSISRTIVEAHGGSIGVRETPGGGTTMWFTLPLAGTNGAGDTGGV